MSTLKPVAPIAAALAGALLSAPALAILYEFDIRSLDNAILVPSNTAAYDAWVATCANAVGSDSQCSYSDPAFQALQSSQTLFFWGNQGDSTNPTIDFTWRGDAPSADISQLRVLTLTDDNGVAAPIGFAGGPKPFRDFFVNPPLDIPFADPVQGRGLFPTWGREGTYGVTEDDLQNFDNTAQFDVTEVLALDVRRRRGTDTLGLKDQFVIKPVGNSFAYWDPSDPAGEVYRFNPEETGPLDVDESGGNQFDRRAPLASGDVLEIRLYSQYDTTEVPGPLAYLGDTLFQFNFSDSGQQLPQSGMKLLDADGNPLNNADFTRDPANPESLSASLGPRRADGSAGATGTIALFNQGEAGSVIEGDVEVRRPDNAAGQTLPSGPLSSVSLGVGQGTGGYDFDLGPANLDYTLVPGGSGQIDVDATKNPSNASVQLAVGETYVEVGQQTVGPLLGVSPDDGARYFAPGSGLDLGSIDPGQTLSYQLVIANLFGTDYADLTDLTFYSLTSDFAGFTNTSTFNFGDGSGAAGELEAGDASTAAGFQPNTALLDFDLTAPDTPGRLLEFTISFLTDQGMGVGAGRNTTPFSFNISLNITGTQDVPAPGALALLGLGLAGLAGVRARRRWVAGRVRGGV
jgi:hypothetical protein